MRNLSREQSFRTGATAKADIFSTRRTFLTQSAIVMDTEFYLHWLNIFFNYPTVFCRFAWMHSAAESKLILNYCFFSLSRVTQTCSLASFHFAKLFQCRLQAQYYTQSISRMLMLQSNPQLQAQEDGKLFAATTDVK